MTGILKFLSEYPFPLGVLLFFYILFWVYPHWRIFLRPEGPDDKAQNDRLANDLERRLVWIRKRTLEKHYLARLGWLLKATTRLLGDWASLADSSARNTWPVRLFGVDPFTEGSYLFSLRLAFLYPLVGFWVGWVLGAEGSPFGVAFLPPEAGGASRFVSLGGLALAGWLFFQSDRTKGWQGWVYWISADVIFAVTFGFGLALALVSNFSFTGAFTIADAFALVPALAPAFVLPIALLIAFAIAFASTGAFAGVVVSLLAIGFVNIVAFAALALAGAGAGVVVGIVVLAFALALALVAAAAAAAAGAFAFGFAGAIAFGLAFVVADTVNFVVIDTFVLTPALASASASAPAFALASAPAFALVPVLVLVLVLAGVLAVAWFANWLQGRLEERRAIVRYWVGFNLLAMGAALGVIAWTFPRVEQSGLAFLLYLLFLGLLPLANGALDWVSLGFTRGFLHAIRRGHHSGVWALGWAGLDMVLALGFLLAIATFTAGLLAGLNAAAVAWGGGPLLDLMGLFAGLAEDPWRKDFLWIHFMMFSTLIPTLIHFLTAGFSGVLLLSPLRRLILGQGFEEGDDPRWLAFAYFSLTPVLALLVPAGLLWGLYVLVSAHHGWVGRWLLQWVRWVAGLLDPSLA